MTRLIIDGGRHGLVHAPAYYAMFPREPSPAGEMTFKGKTTTVIRQAMTLELLLTTLAKSGSGSVVMIVCHAYRGGFYMPLTSASKSVYGDTTAIDQIEKADGIARKADAIRSMPEATEEERKTKIEAWKKLFNSIKPNSVTGTFTLKEAEEFLNKQVAPAFLRPLGLSRFAQAKAFMKKVRAVQDLKLDRIELRACNIGHNTKAMQAFKRLFGCKKLLAPAAETVFLANAAIDTFDKLVALNAQASTSSLPSSSRRGRQAAGAASTTRIRGPLGREIDEALKRQLEKWRRKNTPTREFYTSVQAGTGGTASNNNPPQMAMSISVWELLDRQGGRPTFEYRVFAAGKSIRQVEWPRVKEVIDAMIMPGSSYKSGAMPLSALWTPPENPSGWIPWTWIFPAKQGPPFTTGAVPFVFANEPKYLELIKTV